MFAWWVVVGAGEEHPRMNLDIIGAFTAEDTVGEHQHGSGFTAETVTTPKAPKRGRHGCTREPVW